MVETTLSHRHAMRLTALCLKNIYENIHAALVVAITHSST